ncbi:MAG: hypothetical protein NUW37_18635 [Planctomycetes bacterium]|nr:hypothetical protein [Planctomycetota bacterium]
MAHYQYQNQTPGKAEGTIVQNSNLPPHKSRRGRVRGKVFGATYYLLFLGGLLGFIYYFLFGPGKAEDLTSLIANNPGGSNSSSPSGLVAMKARMDVIDARSAKHDLQIEELNEKVAIHEGRIAQLGTELEGVNSTLDSVNSELQDLNKRLEEQSTTNAQQREINEELRSKIQELTQRFDTFTQQQKQINEQLMRENEALRAQNAELMRLIGRGPG